MTRPVTRPVRRRATVLVGAALLAPLGLAAAGCSPASPSIAPSGVDELVVPLPSLDPDAFVTDVDSPWVDPAAGAGPDVAGVPTVEVPAPGGAGIAGAVDLYAQDVDGNVWWLAREGEWTAGEAGAEAGLVVTATPRLGDGYRAALAPGAGVDLVSEVVDLDATVTVDGTTYDESVVVDTRDAVTGRTERAWYAAGAGRVQTQDLTAD